MSTGSCTQCGSGLVLALDTYKHVWPACLDCGVVTRRRKDQYLVSRLPLVPSLIRDPALRSVLLEDPRVRASEAGAYALYDELCRRGKAGTKWERTYETLRDELATAGFSLDVARILDVSGGPGFFAQTLQARGVDVVVTEYSAEAVQAMADALRVTTARYAYDEHRLRDVLPDPAKRYSAVLVRYSINFCSDLERFAADVAELIEPGGYVYVSSVEPSLGTAVRWSHDEYTYKALYPAEKIRDAFRRAGLEHRLQIPTRHKDYAWDAGYSRAYRAMLLPYVAKNMARIALHGRRRRASETGLARLQQVHTEDVFVAGK